MYKEMTSNRIAFDVTEEGESPPRGYKEMAANMIFNIKLGSGFTRKARFVAEGHDIETPPSTTYTSIISIESVYIVLMLADLNVIDVDCADAYNAHLNGKPKERFWFQAGHAFGVHKGYVVVVVREFYGLKGTVSA